VNVCVVIAQAHAKRARPKLFPFSFFKEKKETLSFFFFFGSECAQTRSERAQHRMVIAVFSFDEYFDL